jgi:predicted ATPase
MVVDARDGALLAVFADAEAAVRAAGEITAAPAPVRVGIHTGEPHPTSRGYVGTDVEQATRIADAAHRGQVVLSSSTAAHLEAAGTALRPLGSHCLTGFAPPIDLYQRGEAAFPPLKTVLTTNLPASASSFLGREEELRQADLFLQQTRLLSVTGPGGAGKTRFALELARRAREERFSDYEDGVFVCFLASLRDPDLVLPTLAQTLSVRERPGGGALEALSARLDEQRLLLLLDNIEHLLPAVSELGQLLASCPELTVLVTSRERLHLEGELVYDLPPLQPDESVALFCERAACAPSQPVEELCARLEGLPLAIELAAARMSLLSPEQLLTRLARRLDLLKASRDADPRQQTLRATIEWSYDLLAPAAQRLFARLSVFAGGCTLEAAEGVCDAELDSLESLLNKSLLRRSGERFWMLETIREYAADLLEGSSEEEELWQRHAEFFAALAERIGPDLRGRDSATLDELARDDGNFRIALQRADASGQIGVFVRLLAALAMYWFSRGPYAEVRAWLESGYQASIDDDRLAARVARGLGVVADWQGDYVLARSAFERALALARSAADRELECACLNGLGVETGYVDDDADAARKLFTECLALAIELGNEFVFAGAANNLGELELSQGRLAEAEKWLQDSLAASERLGEDRGLAMVAGSNLGLVALRTGRTEEAARRFRESLRTAEDLQQPFVQGEYASYLASVAAQRGDPVRAARLLGIAAGIVEKGGGALHPHAHALEEETRTSVRDSLGEQAAADEFAAGRALKRDEAIAYALAENEPIGATANG